MQPIRTIIMGAAGRDFHNFNVLYRDDPRYEVVAYTAWYLCHQYGRLERVTQLLAHGLLHLHGYDHEHDAAEASRMAAKSRRLLKLIAAREPLTGKGNSRKQSPRVAVKQVKP